VRLWGEDLKAFGVAALEERILALSEGDPFVSEPVGQPVMSGSAP
jgi:hypothetical protein